jgi:hypothetical protein
MKSRNEGLERGYLPHLKWFESCERYKIQFVKLFHVEKAWNEGMERMAFVP